MSVCAMNMNSDLPDKLPAGDMAEYRAMCIQDRIEYFVVKINGHWICLEFLDAERDETAYYYFHPSGFVGFGPYAAENAVDKGMPSLRRPSQPQSRFCGKYGRRKLK